MHLQHRVWPADALRKIAETDDLHISPFREDGVTYGTPTWSYQRSDRRGLSTAPRPGWLSAMIPRRRSAGGTGTIGSRSAPRAKYQTLGFKTGSRPSSPK
jgi:hypothetical protein